MQYVTQGTIQVELTSARRKAKITICPIPDYYVKRQDNDCIVFLPRTGRVDAKVFRTKRTFTTKDEGLIGVLATAASQNIAVEIAIKSTKKIVSVKIPAISKAPAKSR